MRTAASLALIFGGLTLGGILILYGHQTGWIAALAVIAGVALAPRRYPW